MNKAGTRYRFYFPEYTEDKKGYLGKANSEGYSCKRM